LLVAACAAVGVWLVPAAPASAATKCSGKGAKGIVSTSSARVYSLPSKGERKIYACLLSQNKRRFLGWEDECQDMTAASAFLLSGPYVGYVETSCSLVSGDQRVVVLNIKTNKIKHEAPAVTNESGPADDPSSYVTDLVMSRSGSVGWIGEYDKGSDGVGNEGDSRQVRVLYDGASGLETLLHADINIVPGSLALGPQGNGGFGYLYWQVGDQPRVGKLPK
jgi:hypothetical protein